MGFLWQSLCAPMSMTARWHTICGGLSPAIRCACFWAVSLGNDETVNKRVTIMKKSRRSILSMNRPTPDPSQEGSRRSSASCQFPSSEGQGWVHGPNARQTVNLVDGFDELDEG